LADVFTRKDPIASAVGVTEYGFQRRRGLDHRCRGRRHPGDRWCHADRRQRFAHRRLDAVCVENGARVPSGGPSLKPPIRRHSTSSASSFADRVRRWSADSVAFAFVAWAGGTILLDPPPVRI
jgi:hypothetical protein